IEFGVIELCTGKPELFGGMPNEQGTFVPPAPVRLPRRSDHSRGGRQNRITQLSAIDARMPLAAPRAVDIDPAGVGRGEGRAGESRRVSRHKPGFRDVVSLALAWLCQNGWSSDEARDG